MTLRDRLQALTAPCREVDAEIAVMFEPGKKWVCDPMDERGPRNFSPNYTASLDATVELVEREMPGRFWAVNAMDRQNNRYIAEVGDKLDDAGAEHSLRAVALLLALLEAKGIE